MLSSAVPTLVGPLITALVIATLTVAFGPVEGLLGGRVENWIFLLMIMEPVALLLGILMLGLDGVWYLLTNYRPVTGWRAWTAGLVAPIPVEIAWNLWRPGQFVGSAFWFAFLAPIVVTAVAIRLALWLSAVASG